MWDQIRSNQRRSAIVVAVLGLLLVVTGAALGVMFGGGDTGAALIGGVVALAIWLVMWMVTINRGDDVMLHFAKARQIEKKDHPQLYNVVEEMTIASQLGSPPRVFIVDDPAPNAFAVGRDPKRAAVAVTTGLLSILDRNELQGVIAHEIGHIKNRDVALMTTAGIMIGAIVLLAEIGRRALWYGAGTRRSRSSGKDGGNAAMVIVALIVVILAPILAQLMYFALSRRREYLADASGALFTRYPEGLASALEKLGGSRIPQADESKVTAPMYIVRPLAEGETRSLSSAFTTHPPLDKRIKTLRAMAGGAGYSDYQAAYAKVHGGKGVIGKEAVAAVGRVEAVTPEPGSAVGGPVAGLAAAAVAETAPTATPRQRMRHASDAFLSASGYTRRTCATCGAIHKIPPELAARVKNCTRCHAPLPTS